MLGVGISEILVIAVVCLVALGPKEMPVLMRKLAILYRQFIGIKDEIRFQILSADRHSDDLLVQEKTKDIIEAKKDGP